MPCLNSWTFNHTPHPLCSYYMYKPSPPITSCCEVCVCVWNLSATVETVVHKKASWLPMSYQCCHLFLCLFCSFLSPWCWTLTVNMWITSAWRWEWWGRHVPLNPVSLTSSRWDIPKESRIFLWCSNYMSTSSALFCYVIQKNKLQGFGDLNPKLLNSSVCFCS